MEKVMLHEAKNITELGELFPYYLDLNRKQRNGIFTWCRENFGDWVVHSGGFRRQSPIFFVEKGASWICISLMISSLGIDRRYRFFFRDRMDFILTKLKL